MPNAKTFLRWHRLHGGACATLWHPTARSVAGDGLRLAHSARVVVARGDRASSTLGTAVRAALDYRVGAAGAAWRNGTPLAGFARAARWW